MATNVQTYRVGVQNRYSAFLEGEEGLALSNLLVKKPTNVANKQQQKNANSGSSKSAASNKVNGKSDASLGHADKKQDAQVKNSSKVNAQQGGQSKASGDAVRRQQRDGGKTQQQQQGQTGRYQNKNRGSNHQDHGSTAEGMVRSPRGQVNGVSGNQPDGSQQQSKENRTVRGANNNPRFNRPRVQNGDKRPDQQDVQQMNGHLPLNEGDKARHQQRRMNNLRFKDPEKRERRTQGGGQQDGGADAQAKSEQQSDKGEGGSSHEQRGNSGPRVRRDGDKNLGDSSNSKPKPPRRMNQNSGDVAAGPNGVARRDDGRDRPAARQRNGFGAGSQHSEGGSRQDRQRPIPNFSDKSDFPSLAS